jgi:integrase
MGGENPSMIRENLTLVFIFPLLYKIKMSLSKQNEIEINILIKKYTKKNQNAILKKIHVIATKDKPMPRTLSSRYSIIKKKFRQKTNDEKFLSNIKPDIKITEYVIKENNKVRDNRRVKSVDKDTLNIIKSFGDSDNLYELAIYLLFVSGRRTSELLESTYINSPKSKYIIIKGIKKRKTKNENGYFIPIIKKKKFMILINKFKKLIKPYKFSVNTFSRQLNRILKKNVDVSLHPHSLRGLYANYMFNFYNPDKLKINTFIKGVLLHQNINSSMSYTQYQFPSNISKSLFS